MGVFPGFGSWINQNSQQPLKAESKRSENVDSEEDDFNYPDKVYYDLKEAQKQADLWHEAEKKHPWHNASPKIKENKSRKILFENGPRQMMRMEKSVACNVFGVYIPISMNLIVDENRKDLMTQYKKEKVRFMKAFEGNYKVEPIFVDKERLCKKRIPMTQEEYKKCSGGQGKLASKLTIDQYYQPYPPFNLPPLSWFIRGMTIKTSKSLLAQVQDTSIAMRTATPMPEETTSNKHEKL
ncbi:uncharacterized protein LOC103837396 isoform X2 [Brassica rapa]|uniref:uncharacterized protein LOC103837396 isoform X2 n=1 Tax=Brassica campestris TaxID=3711 RepID=UPI00142DAB14|nr:uncharacterized protein LOC103837396 isoform X2 [Brassica rapa]